MFSFIKDVFDVLLNFSEYLITKYLSVCLSVYPSLNDETYLIRSTLIDLNLAELNIIHS